LPRLLALALFAWALAAVGPGRIRDGLAAADPRPVGVAILAAPAFVLLKSRRWARLGAGIGMPIPPGEAFRLYAIGLFAGQVTPGQAGDFVKAWALRARRVPLATALLSCLLDRLFDLAALLALGAAAIVAFAGGGRSLLPVALLLATVCAALAAAMGGRWRGPAVRLLARLVPTMVRARLARHAGLRSLAAARLGPGAAVAALGLTALAWAFSLGRVWLCFQAVGVRLGLVPFLIVVVLVTLSGIVSVGGIGARDVALWGLLANYGYPGGQALAISLLILIVNSSNAVPGFLLWLREPLPLRRIAPPDNLEGSEAKPGSR
jgi:hypothetical protein